MGAVPGTPGCSADSDASNTASGQSGSALSGNVPTVRAYRHHLLGWPPTPGRLALLSPHRGSQHEPPGAFGPIKKIFVFRADTANADSGVGGGARMALSCGLPKSGPKLWPNALADRRKKCLVGQKLSCLMTLFSSSPDYTTIKNRCEMAGFLYNPRSFQKRS